MKVPPLSQRRNAFDQRNTFVHALLGLRVYGERFDAYVEDLCAAPRRPGKVVAENGPPERPVLIVLGLFALWRRIRSELDGWEASHRSPRAQDDPRSKRRPQRLEALLR